MITVSIEEMQRDFAGYLKRVQSGETLVVMQADQPVAEVKPLTQPEHEDAKQPRPFGLCAGAFVVPDDFDDPLYPFC